MSRTGGNPDGQDDVDAIFDELVADLRAEGVGTRSDLADPPAQRLQPGPDPAPEKQPSDWRASDAAWDETMLSDEPVAEEDSADADEHFVPPEPPPLPRPTSSMIIVGLFFVVGLVLLITPSLIGIGTVVATPLGILSLAAGLGFLLLHARDDNRPPGSDPQNGAQV